MTVADALESIKEVAGRIETYHGLTDSCGELLEAVGTIEAALEPYEFILVSTPDRRDFSV